MTAAYPTWWDSLPGATPLLLAALRRALDRHGISLNDRRSIDLIWHDLRRIDAQRRLGMPAANIPPPPDKS